MTKEELISIAKEAFENKSKMMSLAKNNSIKNQIIEETQFLNQFFPSIPIKIRCLCLIQGLTRDTYPRCPQCGSPVGFNKAYNDSLNQFCSDSCSKLFGRLGEEVRSKLKDKEWLYEKRIIQQLSYESIGALLGISEIPVKAACKKLDIPKVRFNESNAVTQAFLRNKAWLIEEHIDKHRTLDDLAQEINSTKATLSRFLEYHDIVANPPNSYPRKSNKVSKECQEVIDFIESLGFLSSELEINNRTILNGLELDIYIKSKKIAIEYNGLYSHVMRRESDQTGIRKDRNYHVSKTLKCALKGIELIHIWSDSWLQKKEIWKSMLRAKLNKVETKIYARNCLIRPLLSWQRNIFLNENHIQGTDSGQIAFGLFHLEELVCVMSFAKSRFNRNYDWELSRFASLKNTIVLGGFSKLLSHFEKNYKGSIISYADRSRSKGNVYEKNGFTLLRENHASYWYVPKTYDKRLHRSGFMKKRIAPNDPRPEWEVMLELGYYQLWDCGQSVWVKE